MMIVLILKVIIWLCVVIPLMTLDVLLYIFSGKWLFNIIALTYKLRMQSIEYGNATETHGCPRRSAKMKSDNNTLIKGDYGTIYDMIQNAVQTYSNKTAMVSRKFIESKKINKTDKFPTKIYDDSKLDEITYKQFNENIINFGSGLRKLGMESIPSLKKENETIDDKKDGNFVIVLFEDTCQQWTTAMHGAFTQSIVVATCYATLGEDAVINAVNETNASVLFLNWKNAIHFASLSKKMPTLKTIIASTHEMPKNNTTLPKNSNNDNKNIQIITSDEVIQLGKQQSYKPVPPKPTDVAVIMYTSGSTGKPKGVMMQHTQLVAGISGMVTNVPIRPGKEIFVSYLPLAHILALQIENVLLYHGAKLCYTDPKQLSITLPMYQPTIFAGVPAVWDRLMNGLKNKLNAKPTFKLLFDILLQWKLFVTKYIIDDTRASNMFFHLICKKLFGGILQFGVTGGGPISSALQKECRAVFCCPIVQGYALTETCVGGCFQSLDDPRTGIVGPPVPCVEICLQSEPDLKDTAGMSYLHTDRKSSKGENIIGRGEICIRGPSISMGYYKLPDKTKEEFDIDGWFHTGDVGQFTSDGVLQIIDRKKNLVKLRGGEYVAIESMEMSFGRSPFVNAVCVLANGDFDTPFTIVSVDTEYIQKWAKENNNKNCNSMTDLLNDSETRETVKNSLIQYGKDAGLSKLELRIKDCQLVDKEWLPGSGMTASMKLDRSTVYKMHKNELKEMFQRNGVKTTMLD